MTELEIVQQAWGDWMEFKVYQQKQELKNCRRMLGATQRVWQYPKPGSVKLNVSSSREDAVKGAGVDMIARNELGATLQASSVDRKALANPMVSVVDATRVALLVAQQNG